MAPTSLNLKKLYSSSPSRVKFGKFYGFSTSVAGQSSGIKDQAVLLTLFTYFLTTDFSLKPLLVVLQIIESGVVNLLKRKRQLL